MNYMTKKTYGDGGRFIIMLDVDGVLNSQNSKNVMWANFPIDPFKILLLHRITEATGAKIVVSSSWRFSPEGMEELKARVPDIIGTTPLEDNPQRGTDISDWLSTQSVMSNFWVRDYVILDDDFDAGFGHDGHFFQTTWLNGLTDEIAEDVINYLNRERDD